MNEVYRDTRKDRQYIASYLRNVRSLYPNEIFTMDTVARLSEVNHGRREALINERLFWKIIAAAKRQVHRGYSERFCTMSSKSYFFGIPESTNEVEGFHSEHSIGYQYWYRSAFAVVLNPRLVRNINVRTVEAARSYLHDSMHYSTFVTFRRARQQSSTREEAKKSVPRLYREQYGINFRNSTGLSYSSVGLTAQVPDAINLNLLMDGVIVILTSTLLKGSVDVSGLGNLTALEREILDETIELRVNDGPQSYGSDFFSSITRPSEIFIQHWGGDMFLRLIFRTMMHGNLTKLKKYFNSRYGEDGAWKKVFKRPDFSLKETSHA